MRQAIASCTKWGVVFSILTIGNVALAQIAGLEGYKNRKINAEPPAIEAVLKRDLDALKILWVSQRQRLNDRGRHERSALMVAAIIGDGAVLDFLLEKDASINVTDSAGNTALHYASTQGYSTIVAHLLAAGSNPDARNHNGEVALFHAARQGHWDTIKLLLDAGADTSVRDYTARDLMDHARETKDRRLLRRLQEYGL